MSHQQGTLCMLNNPPDSQRDTAGSIVTKFLCLSLGNLAEGPIPQGKVHDSSSLCWTPFLLKSKYQRESGTKALTTVTHRAVHLPLPTPLLSGRNSLSSLSVAMGGDGGTGQHAFPAACPPRHCSRQIYGRSINGWGGRLQDNSGQRRLAGNWLLMGANVEKVPQQGPEGSMYSPCCGGETWQVPAIWIRGPSSRGWAKFSL